MLELEEMVDTANLLCDRVRDGLLLSMDSKRTMLRLIRILIEILQEDQGNLP